ncbi:hypothetical protein MKX08_006951 [Trichoderma sp. CBMAI-0020]|nr:hypothetical protein MKX08_006951 [Trichoderma sp. CBMAI-0020]
MPRASLAELKSTTRHGTAASIWLTAPLTPPPLAPFCCSLRDLPFFAHRSAPGSSSSGLHAEPRLKKFLPPPPESLAPTSAKPVAAARMPQLLRDLTCDLRPATCNSAPLPSTSIAASGVWSRSSRLPKPTAAPFAPVPSLSSDAASPLLCSALLCSGPRLLPPRNPGPIDHTPPASEEDKTDPARLRFRVQFTGLHATGAAALLKPAARSHDRRLLCAWAFDDADWPCRLYPRR